MKRSDTVRKSVGYTIVHYTIIGNDGYSVDGTTSILGKYRERAAAAMCKKELGVEKVLIRNLEYSSETFEMPLNDFINNSTVKDS